MNDQTRRDAEKILREMSFTGQRTYFDSWGRIEASINRNADPGMMVFEVHHTIAAARTKFYEGIIAGKMAIDLENEMLEESVTDA